MLGALAAVLVLAARLMGVGVLGQVAATAPFAVLATRRPYRVVWTSSVVAGVLGFLTGGTAPLVTLGIAALIGWPVGVGVRRRWGVVRVTLLCLLTAWPPIAMFTLAVLTLFSRTRQLTLDNVAVQWRGNARILDRLGLDDAVTLGDRVTAWVIEHWYLAIPAAQSVFMVAVATASLLVCRPVVRRVVEAMGDGSPRPSPRAEALAAFTPQPGAITALVGPNGCGKSTLLRSLAGTEHVAFVAQRPESQVLGARVAEDVRWGLPHLTDADVAALLERVGLAGLEHADTATLSGGQLQRLALAAALARRPAVLLSDESTAMLDPTGREAVWAVLRSLAHDHGVAVVHATHLPTEIAAADVVVDAEALRVVQR